MNKKELIEKVNELHRQNKANDGEVLLDEYLVEYPNDVDILLRLAVFRLVLPLPKIQKSLDCINKIFNIDSNNIDAHLLFACINHFNCLGYDEKLLVMLDNLKANGLEEQSIIEYAKSWSYCKLKMWDLYEQALIKSVQLYPLNVWNCESLGKFYMKQGKIEEGQELIIDAIENVRVVFLDSYNHSDCDYSSVEEYFDEFIRGIHISILTFESLKQNRLV